MRDLSDVAHEGKGLFEIIEFIGFLDSVFY